MGEARAAVPNENLIMGWDNIAAMFGVSVRKMISYREELQNGGFIFYRYEGKPPQKRVCAFPSSLKKWIAIKSAKGEVF